MGSDERSDERNARREDEPPYAAPETPSPWSVRGRSLSESRTLRFLFFGLLYVAQGIPWGFLSESYRGIFLVDRGLSNEEIGQIMQFAYLPWALKILIAPLLDRYRGGALGRRRPFIVLAEMTMGIPLLFLAAADPKRLGVINAVLFLHNCFAAIQDVAVDGLAVDILPVNERGRANSIMWAGKIAGVALGGGGGVLAEWIGWQGTFVAVAIAVWLIMLVPLALRERPTSEDTRLSKEGKRIDRKEIVRTLRFAPALLGLFIALLTPVGYALAGTFTPRLYRADLGLSAKSLWLLSAIGTPAGVVGAMLGGAIADKLDARKTMAISMAAIALVLFGFGSLENLWPSYAFLIVFTVLLQLTVCAYNASSLGFYMTLSNPALGATQFTTYMAMTNLCYSFTAPYGGRMADRFGPSKSFLIAAAIQLVSIPLLLLCDARKAEAHFRAEEEAS